MCFYHIAHYSVSMKEPGHFTPIIIIFILHEEWLSIEEEYITFASAFKVILVLMKKFQFS